MQRDRNKRPYNPSVMLRKRPCSMCSPLGRVLDILCNPALCCKSRLVPVRASFLRRTLFVQCLFRIRRHLSPACPERLELRKAIRTPGTRLQSQRPIRSTSRFSSLDRLPSTGSLRQAQGERSQELSTGSTGQSNYTVAACGLILSSLLCNLLSALI
jgi:hypothetical protein